MGNFGLLIFYSPNCDYVHAPFTIYFWMALQVILRCVLHMLLLCGRYGFFGIAEFSRATRFHFYKDESCFLPPDQIDLAILRAHIVLQDHIAKFF